MVWYGLIPDRGARIPSALAALGAKSELHATSKYITRRLAEDISTNPARGDHVDCCRDQPLQRTTRPTSWMG